MTTIPTPKWAHTTAQDYESVYEPAEDSFLLLDALEKEFNTQRPPTLCLEIGSGSGLISAAVSSVFKNQCFVIACDINDQACAFTQDTMRINKAVQFDVCLCDFMQSVWHRLEGQVDLLLCNPPYVPTHTQELGSRDLSAAWAGGTDGMSFTYELISRLPGILSEHGSALLVLEQANRPQEVMSMASRRFSLLSDIIIQRRAGREHLYVIKFSKMPADQ